MVYNKPPDYLLSGRHQKSPKSAFQLGFLPIPLAMIAGSLCEANKAGYLHFPRMPLLEANASGPPSTGRKWSEKPNQPMQGRCMPRPVRCINCRGDQPSVLHGHRQGFFSSRLWFDPTGPIPSPFLSKCGYRDNRDEVPPSYRNRSCLPNQVAKIRPRANTATAMLIVIPTSLPSRWFSAATAMNIPIKNSRTVVSKRCDRAHPSSRFRTGSCGLPVTGPGSSRSCRLCRRSTNTSTRAG